jgi:hypothetical protein
MTTIGLTTRPTSLTDQYLSISTLPVSGSISTSQTWQPFGHVASATELVDSNTIFRWGCFCASSNRPDRAIGAGDPEDAIAVFDIRRRRFELVRREVLRLHDGALSGDLHRRAADEQRREPALPKPVPRSVSPNANLICSMGTPNTSTASWENVVRGSSPSAASPRRSR